MYECEENSSDESVNLNELPDVLREPTESHSARTGGSFDNFHETLERYLKRETEDADE